MQTIINLLYQSANSTQPLINIVIPSYNRLPFLQEAVASVITQTYKNWELVVVDDGSTDGTAAWIRSLQDKRINVFSVVHCRNIAVLRNAGVGAGSGEWVAFLDSDDIWMPEKLQLQLKYLQQTGNSWSYGGFELMNESGQTVPNKSGDYTAVSGWITKELLTNEVSVAIGSLLLKRKLFNEIEGFDSNPGFLFREDYELVFRLSLLAVVTALPGLLVKVREHPGRSTNTIEDGHERTVFLYAHFAKLSIDKGLKKIARQRMAYHLTAIASRYIEQKKYWRAFRQLGKGFLKGDKLRHVFFVIRNNINKRNSKS